jgi:hypothetical protein
MGRLTGKGKKDKWEGLLGKEIKEGNKMVILAKMNIIESSQLALNRILTSNIPAFTTVLT